MASAAQTSSPEVGHTTEVLAVVDRYADAEAIVHRLASRDFPVEHLRIVGDDLEMIEQVTGRLTIWSAIGRGVAAGVVTGVLIGWIFGIFDWVSPLIAGLLLALYGAIFGAVVGVIVGAIHYALTSNRRAFVSEATVAPSRFQVLADSAFAAQARQVLQQADTGASFTAGRDGTVDGHPADSAS
jgi:hypothetical protein